MTQPVKTYASDAHADTVAGTGAAVSWLAQVASILSVVTPVDTQADAWRMQAVQTYTAPPAAPTHSTPTPAVLTPSTAPSTTTLASNPTPSTASSTLHTRRVLLQSSNGGSSSDQSSSRTSSLAGVSSSSQPSATTLQAVLQAEGTLQVCKLTASAEHFTHPIEYIWHTQTQVCKLVVCVILPWWLGQATQQKTTTG